MNVPDSSLRPVPRFSRFRSRRFLLVVLILIAVGIGLSLTVLKRPSIQIPVVSLDGMHPDVAEQIDRLRERVESSPALASAWGNYGMVLLQHQRLHEALICFDQASLLQPPSARWPYFAGTILEQTNYSEALRRYQKALALDPDYVPLLLRTASVQIQLHDYESARHLLDRAATDAVGLASASVQQVRLVRLENSLAAAEQIVESVRAAQMVSRELLLELAILKMAAGKTDAALQLREEAKKLPPVSQLQRDPWMDQLRQFDATGAQSSLAADQLREQGQFQQAAMKLAVLARQFPDRSRPALNRAMLLLEMGDTVAAEKELELLKQKFPDDALILFSLAYARFGQGDLASAESLLKEAIRLKPDYSPALQALADVFERSSRPTDAIMAWKQAIAATPEDIRIHLALIKLLIQEGQRDDAAIRLAAIRTMPVDDPAVQSMIDELSQRLATPQQRQTSGDRPNDAGR